MNVDAQNSLNVTGLPSRTCLRVDLREQVDGQLAYAICTCATFSLYFADLEAEAFHTATSIDQIWPSITWRPLQYL